jgi:hypothetical protein
MSLEKIQFSNILFITYILRHGSFPQSGQVQGRTNCLLSFDMTWAMGGKARWTHAHAHPKQGDLLILLTKS